MLTDVNAGQMTEDLVIDRDYTYYELSSQTGRWGDNMCHHFVFYTFRDWSLITGRGGYKMGKLWV